MKSGGLFLMNALAVCEMSRTFWRMGKLFMKGDLENLFKGPVILFEAVVECYPISARETSQGSNLAGKFCQEYSSDMHWLRITCLMGFGAQSGSAMIRKFKVRVSQQGVRAAHTKHQKTRRDHQDVLHSNVDLTLRLRQGWYHGRIHVTFSLYICVLCYCVVSASAYTSTGSLVFSH